MAAATGCCWSHDIYNQGTGREEGERAQIIFSIKNPGPFTQGIILPPITIALSTSINKVRIIYQGISHLPGDSGLLIDNEPPQSEYHYAVLNVPLTGRSQDTG